MRTITVDRRIPASPESVWAVLADFPNISLWNRGVRSSHATSEATEGVGATRHCDLSPLGTLQETVREWDDGKRLVVSIDEAKRLPMHSATATFLIEPTEDGSHVTIDYVYDPQGPVGAVLDRQLTKGFRGFLEDLETAATGR